MTSNCATPESTALDVAAGLIFFVRRFVLELFSVQWLQLRLRLHRLAASFFHALSNRVPHLVVLDDPQPAVLAVERVHDVHRFAAPARHLKVAQLPSILNVHCIHNVAFVHHGRVFKQGHGYDPA